MELGLLLCDAQGQGVGIDAGLLERTPPLQPCSVAPGGEEERFLLGDPDDLCNGWGVLWPEGRAELRAHVADLVAWRQAQIGRSWREAGRPEPPPQVLEFGLPAGWDVATFVAKQLRVRPTWDQPKFLLILGDIDGIGVGFQQDLCAYAHVGRLVFQDKAGYQRYVAKLIAHEKAEALEQSPRLLTWSAWSGEPKGALKAGEEFLFGPLLQAAQDPRQDLPFAPKRVIRCGPKTAEKTWERLRALAAEPVPTVLLSLSHGQGDAAWSDADKRALQGRLALGDGVMLAPESLGEGVFLPGGVWFLYACFGGGTPVESVYGRWLRELRDVDPTYRIDAVLRSFSLADPPFVAKTPQVALGNALGPLAVFAHIDLAFCYAFQADKGQELRPDGASAREGVALLRELLGLIGGGARVGRVMSHLHQSLAAIDQALLAFYGGEDGELGQERRWARGLHWMARQDIRAFVLLGDPAARMRVQPGSGVGRARFDVDAVEQAIFAWFRGELREVEGVSPEELERLCERFVEAGRAAIRREAGG